MKKSNYIIIFFCLDILLLIILIYDLRPNNKNVKIDKCLTNNNDKVHINIIKEDDEASEEDSNMSNENSGVILTLEEIDNYNEKIRNKTNEIYDLNNYKSMKKDEILKYIIKYEIPKNKYNNGKLITNNEINIILNNRNIDDVKDLLKIQKGIIIKRANLRSFPTNIGFYDTKINDYDRIQETELLVNTGILILHESQDKLWYFIMSPIYVGWIEKETVALASDENYNFFINNSNFGIIIDKYVKIDDITLDMSVKIPYVNNKFILPIKLDSNEVGKREVDISNAKINIGYLPYTKENIIKEAYKYLGEPYSWGGLNNSVDCSSFIMNIYKTFGFNFPRNTSSQNKSVGEVISLINKNNNEKLNLINNTEPSLLYQEGHVMLYIGKKNNKHYIIHASGEGMVKESILDNSNYLKNTNKLVLVK